MKQSSLKKLALGAAWALALFGGPWAGPVQAVHDVDLFELDGNAVDEGTNGDDWNLIYCDSIDPDRNGPCTGVPASSALVGSFFTDPVEDPSDDIFAGAKDSLDIEAGAPQDWQWKIGEPNDKNDIEHAFASIYRDPVSLDFILYFGLDKLSNNGDAALGFWFLQNDVTMLGDGSSNPPCSPSGCPFSDGHEVGDVLVQADITSGGDVPKFDVFTWGPNGLLNDPVAPAQGELTKAIEGSQCDPAVMGDGTCAIMNTDNVFAPWPYLFKFSGGVAESDVFPVATFFEAGLNLDTLFPNGVPCISAFLAETRQSQQETAELEDKVLGGFDLCSVFVTKTGPEIAKVGDPVTYTVTITNDGALPLTRESITDTLAGDLTDGTNTFIDSSDCGADLQPGESCTIVYTLTQPPSSDPLENTVTVRYDRGDDMITGSASHGVNLIQPSITFDKQAEGSNGPLDVLQGATVDYTLALNNTSSADTPALVCVITDDLLVIDPNDTDGDGNPNTFGVTLTSNNFTTVNASKSFPTPGSFTNTASVSCLPEGFTNELTAEDSVTVNVLPANVVLMVEKNGDAFSKEGDPVNYGITITNISNVAVTLTDVTDTVLGDLLDTATPNPFLTGGTCVDNQVLAASASCTITATRTTGANDPDPLVNVVTATVVGAVGGTVSLSDDHSVDLVAPAYTLTKSCASPDPVPAGESANFEIRIVNTGDVDLVMDVTDTLLGINLTGVTLGQRGGAACTDADFAIGATTGCLLIEDGIIATGDQVVNTVNTSATLPASFGLPNKLDESAGAVCEVEQGDATRTWGFWKTHGSDGEDFSSPVDFGYTCHVFEDHQPLAGTMDLGWKVVTSCEQLFDIFWSSKAKNSDGSRRDKLCQVKLQASRQLAAAQLNEALDNGADAGDAIDNLIAELGGDMKRKDIIGYMAELAGFNESGDDVAIIDNDGAIIPHADPRGTRLTAEEGFSDCQ